MKKVVLSLAIAALALGANAQKKEASKGSMGTHFGIGINANLPIGDYSDFYSFGVGGQVSAEHNFSENFSGLASLGYTTYVGKTVDYGTIKVKYASAGFIPVMVGARYYAAPQFFLGAKVGYAVGANTGNKGGFAYEPQVGFNSERFQASVGYNGVSLSGGSSFSAIAATFVYKFN
jgi:hypothetical protein